MKKITFEVIPESHASYDLLDYITLIPAGLNFKEYLDKSEKGRTSEEFGEIVRLANLLRENHQMDIPKKDTVETIQRDLEEMWTGIIDKFTKRTAAEMALLDIFMDKDYDVHFTENLIQPGEPGSTLTELHMDAPHLAHKRKGTPVVAVDDPLLAEEISNLEGEEQLKKALETITQRNEYMTDRIVDYLDENLPAEKGLYSLKTGKAHTDKDRAVPIQDILKKKLEDKFGKEYKIIVKIRKIPTGLFSVKQKEYRKTMEKIYKKPF